MASPLSHPRVGIVVPKQGRTAVNRNRLKRRLRELVRLYILPVTEPMDLVVLARHETYDASFEELQVELVDVMQQLRRALQKSG